MGKKVLASGKLGAIGDFEVGIENGSLYEKVEISAIDIACEGLTLAKEKIPGHFDDVLIDAAIAKLQDLKNSTAS